ncbi:hypothetical protein CLV98_11246 [Dyadobacter jejuensis]|uniref:Hpt domain-containing protein n=1 Tax=Dyadobacter jejuensis TaxID=1082580 RepID=A0A316AEC1_9BACT|nr:hypothetical protein [Dyadobacter jejuensis]PWJ55952.1 hypothetical protein CLV98_11246 [Dyadobacter jejuensis]
MPESHAALTKAKEEDDRLKIQRVAHQMKTSISIMGLDSWLMPKLDLLEDHDRGSQEIQETVLVVRTICQEALQEAQSFYNHVKRTASPT